MNFPLKTVFAVFHRFCDPVCKFSFVPRNYLISFLVSLMTHSLFKNMFFSLHVFGWFWASYWSWFLVSCYCDLRKCLIWFQFFWICYDFFYVLPCGLCLRMIHVHLRRMCILVLWDEMVYKYQLNLFNLVCHLRWLFPCWFLSGRSVQWWQWCVKILYNDCIVVYLFLKVHQDFVFIFRCSYIGGIYVYEGYILFLDFSL